MDIYVLPNTKVDHMTFDNKKTFIIVNKQHLPYVHCTHLNNIQTTINKDMASTRKKLQRQQKKGNRSEFSENHNKMQHYQQLNMMMTMEYRQCQNTDLEHQGTLIMMNR